MLTNYLQLKTLDFMKLLTKHVLAVLSACLLAFGLQAQTTQIVLDVDALSSSFPAEISWDLLDGSAAVVASRACGSYSLANSSDTLDLNNGETYCFNAYDDWGDGWNGGSWTISSPIGVLATGIADNGVSGDLTDDCIGRSLEESFCFDPAGAISGCTDSTAINYNPAATFDDGSCVYPATNDECADAINIDSCYVGSNVGATFGGETLPTACIDGSVTPSDIWFSTTVPASGNLSITLTLVPGFSSIVELYETACDSLGTGILTSLGACNNYGSGDGFSITGLTPGATLLIRWWDFGSDQEGPLEICIEDPAAGCTDPCAPNFDPTATVDDGSCLSNPDLLANFCSIAPLFSAGTYSFSTSGLTVEAIDVTSCTADDLIAGWMAYNVPTEIDTLWVYTCGSSYDTGLSLWDGCDTSATEIACNDDGQREPDPANPFSTSSCGGVTLQSAIALTGAALDAVKGTTIYIRVSGFNSTSGCGDITIEEVVTPCDNSVAPQNPSHVDGVATATLNWDPVTKTIACQVSGTRLVPAGPSPSVNIIGFEPSTTLVPYAAAGAGTTWEWKVRCACSIPPDPIVATPFSVTDTFDVPAPKEGQLFAIENTLFPNPASDVLFVTVENNEAVANVEFAIVDVMGRVVEARNQDVDAGQTSITFDVSTLTEGIYFMQVTTNGEISSEEFTVIR